MKKINVGEIFECYNKHYTIRVPLSDTTKIDNIDDDTTKYIKDRLQLIRVYTK